MSAQSKRARAPTSSSSTQTLWTTSPTRGRLHPCIFGAPQWTARRTSSGGGPWGIVGGMNPRIFAVGLLALVTALAAAPAAQWPLFKRADAPRLSDGSGDLTASPPTFLGRKPY